MLWSIQWIVNFDFDRLPLPIALLPTASYVCLLAIPSMFANGVPRPSICGLPEQLYFPIREAWIEAE